ncbi:MAG: hypothetical protein U0353_33315 [Sandaracinus sp.]
MSSSRLCLLVMAIGPRGGSLAGCSGLAQAGVARAADCPLLAQ